MAEREVEGVDLDALEEFYEAFELAVLAALGLTMRRALRDDAVAPTLARLSLDDLNVIPGVWAAQVPALAEQVQAAYIEAARMQADAYVKAGGLVADVADEDVIDVPRYLTSEHQASLDYLESATNRLVGIGDELWSDARGELLVSLDLGEGITQARDRVKKTTEVTRPRAVSIARTELVGASNAGSIAFMRSTGEVAGKRWIATLSDGRTRPAHRAAHGQTVPINDKFMVGGALLDHPGDPNGPAAMVIQCRCTAGWILTGDEDQIPDQAANGDTLAASAHEETAMTMTFVEGPTDVETAALVAAMDPEQTAPWEGVLCVEGQRTGDHRAFEGISWGNLPMPLRWNQEDSHGGMPTTKAVLVGRIDAIEKRGAEIWGTGLIDLGSENGREVHRLMGTPDAPAFLSGVSIDADDPMNGLIEVEFPAGCDTLGEGATPDQMIRCSEPELVTYHDIRIRAATLVDIPAIVTGQIYLTGMAELVGPGDVEEIAMAASINEPTMADVVESLTAAAYQVTLDDTPPAWWFEEPELPEIGGITITDSGRLYGLLAPAGVQHRSYVGSGKRVTVPLGNVDYSRFMNRVTVVTNEDGTTRRIATGPVTMSCGHAPITGPTARSAADSMQVYDDSCSIFATICVGENKSGVWVAGAVLADVTPSQLARALACQLSGDWRPHGDRRGWREMVAALMVPCPGLPVANKAGARVSMRGDALVASSAPVRFEPSEESHSCGCGSDGSADTANAARLIAASCGRDKATRARELYLSVKG